MTKSEVLNPSPSKSLRSFASLHVGVGNRWLLLVIAAVAILVGLWLNWGWLAAVGIAPLILGALPCAAMCALGLCMMQMGRTGTTPTPSSDSAQDADSTLPMRSDSGGSLDTSGSYSASISAE
jgi:hypothetical protein